jgi:MoxR-like ATPase
VTPEETGKRATDVLHEVERVVVGKHDPLTLILVTVLAGGHVLIEDLPGLGKTLIAKSFAQALGLEFTRVQFTPDLLPADITGSAVYDQATGELNFRRGALFTNLLLADEVNRTPPKTQAALLEAMAEGQVSADGHTHRLPEPFVVLATDNPLEYEGTYPLPEAQLDRFMTRVRIGYLTPSDEMQMVIDRLRAIDEQAVLRQVVNREELLEMRRSLDDVTVDDSIVDYGVRLVAATREHPSVIVGASPRGSLALMHTARAYAVCAGRDYVIPEDVKAVAVAVLPHRLSLRPEMWVRQLRGDDVVAELLDAVQAPATYGR